MNPYSRSLGLTAALLMAAAVSILVSANPPVADAVSQSQEAAAGAPLPAIAPISLTDPDGQELIIEDLRVDAAIHGMLSLTEIEFRFRNPQAKRIEGRFAMTLPPNAAISRFAKEVNGELMEGEVVERLRANQVYEQYLHQMRDPALLEQDHGNRFSARIFPIEANDSVRILLSYTALLPARNGVRTYTMPLRGIPEVGHFEFRAIVAPIAGDAAGAPRAQSGRLAQTSVDVFSREESGYRPDADIELRFDVRQEPGQGRVFRAGDFYVASIRPDVRVASAAVPQGWTFYVDTSASSAEGAEHRIRAIETLLRSLPPNDAVTVLAFDNGVVPLTSGSARTTSRAIGDVLRNRLFLGGTDLVAALRHAARVNDRGRAIVFVSDLAPTLGSTSPSDVLEASRAFPAGARVHALILGSRHHAAVARQITAGRGRVVTIPFSEGIGASARAAAEALRRPLGASFDVRDAGAEWIYPTSFNDVQPGDEVLVLGRSRAGAQPQITGAGIDALSASPLPASTFAPLLEREAYRAYLDYLAEREAAEPSDAIRRALATEQVRLSIEQRVMIPRTTMLVLENEWEYQRWGLDRRALAAILTIDAGGIARIDRQRTPPQMRGRPPVLQQRMRTAPAIEDRDAAVEAPQEAPASPPAVGGVLGGQVGGRAANDVRAEAITVTATSSVAERSVFPSAIVPPAAPPPPPVAKRADENWTRSERPTRDDIGRMRATLRNEPRNRALYNQLSDALVTVADWRGLRELAIQWQPYDADNPHVYEILGLAVQNLGDRNQAARAYASLIEVATAKPELLQRAGLLLARVGSARLAETPLRRALELRPDRVNSHRHLALMLWLDGRPDEAARVLEDALRQTFPVWYGDVHRVVREELAYVYRSWGAKSPDRRAEIEDRARDLGVDLSRRDDLRVTLTWETDANDVDLHVVDPAGEESFYGHKRTSSGLELYQDVTQGLGPEVIRTDRAERGTYHVGVRYFAAGPMGVSRGLVTVVRAREGHEPSVEVLPFRLMEGGAPIRHVASVEVK